MCSHQALDVGLADELFHHIHEMTLRHDSIDLVFHCVRPETVHVAEQVFRTTRMTQKFCLGFRKPFHTERIPDYGPILQRHPKFIGQCKGYQFHRRCWRVHARKGY